MPYISQDLRNVIDPEIQQLLDKITRLPLEKQDGALNYAVTKLLKGIYADGNYYTYNRSLGVLSAINAEWYRRVVAPYEDIKILENGDV